MYQICLTSATEHATELQHAPSVYSHVIRVIQAAPLRRCDWLVAAGCNGAGNYSSCWLVGVNIIRAAIKMECCT